jgi:hypothetical protein
VSLDKKSSLGLDFLAKETKDARPVWEKIANKGGQLILTEINITSPELQRFCLTT